MGIVKKKETKTEILFWNQKKGLRIQIKSLFNGCKSLLYILTICPFQDNIKQLLNFGRKRVPSFFVERVINKNLIDFQKIDS